MWTIAHRRVYQTRTGFRLPVLLLPTTIMATSLGKRSRQPDQEVSSCEQLQTPEQTPNPKRAKTTLPVLDGDGNKENIAPLNVTPVNSAQNPSSSFSPPMTSRAARALRRSTTEVLVTPPRGRGSK